MINELAQAVVLGVVQGLTEFIPVSSSGHLELVPKLFGWSEPGIIFMLFVHAGTLLALLFHFRFKIWNYLKVIWKAIRQRSELNRTDNNDLRIILMVILAAIPAALAGFLLEDKIESLYETAANSDTASLLTISAVIVVGVVFIFSDYIFTGKKQTLEQLTIPKALFIGIAQAAALLRGVSRSGITLLAGMFVKLDRESAAEFSFLLSIPIIGGSTMIGIYKLLELPAEQISSQLPLNLAGLVAAFVSGLIAIRFLLNYLKQNGLSNFGWYRILFGLCCLFILFS